MPQLLMLLSETNWSAVELVAGEIRLEQGGEAAGKAARLG